MHDPASHQHVTSGTAQAAPSLLRASVVQRIGIALALAAVLWLAVLWALQRATP